MKGKSKTTKELREGFKPIIMITNYNGEVELEIKFFLN